MLCILFIIFCSIFHTLLTFHLLEKLLITLYSLELLFLPLKESVWWVFILYLKRLARIINLLYYSSKCDIFLKVKSRASKPTGFAPRKQNAETSELQQGAILGNGYRHHAVHLPRHHRLYLLRWAHWGQHHAQLTRLLVRFMHTFALFPINCTLVRPSATCAVACPISVTFLIRWKGSWLNLTLFQVGFLISSQRSCALYYALWHGRAKHHQLNEFLGVEGKQI